MVLKNTKGGKREMKKDIKKLQEQMKKLQAQLKETETAFHTEIGKKCGEVIYKDAEFA